MVSVSCLTLLRNTKMRRKHHIDDEAEINITPMLDIVFIMLIFFIVTTSFVKEQGLEISRPSNSPPAEVQKEDRGPIVVRIDAGSLISVKGRVLERGAVQANLEREKAEKPTSPLVIAAHPEADTEALVNILDAAKAVGIESVSVATTTQ
jgi:biopolymer transport protein ExbD